MKARILTGDMRETLKLLPDDSIDAIVTDPPYGLSFMGKGWDHSVPGPDYFKELLRVAKPGAHIVAFSGTRTGHRLACAYAGTTQAKRANTHPTVKPIALMQWLIKLITPPGGIVLDPFNGSGSTGCAAVSLGHRYIGCELNPEYVDISMARMRAWAKG